MLTECKMVDSFRARNPEAKANYTYWSVRTKARGDNKGLRLCAPRPTLIHPCALPCCHGSDQLSTTRLVCRDYWIVSESLLPAAGGAPSVNVRYLYPTAAGLSSPGAANGFLPSPSVSAVPPSPRASTCCEKFWWTNVASAGSRLAWLIDSRSSSLKSVAVSFDVT